MCAVRFLGFVPEDIASIPDEALVFVCGQVDAAPHELLAYGARSQTRSDHLQLVLNLLGWRRAEEADRGRLADWLIERAVEHDAPATLMGLVSEHLRARSVLRPPVETLTRMIATARANAYRRHFRERTPLGSDLRWVRPRFRLRPYANRRPRGHPKFNTGI